MDKVPAIRSFVRSLLGVSGIDRHVDMFTANDDSVHGGYGGGFQYCDVYGRVVGMGDRERTEMMGDYTLFLRCLSLAPRFGDKRVLAKVEHGELHIRPNDITHFKTILADHGLMDNPGIVAVINWLTVSKDRYLKFRK